MKARPIKLADRRLILCLGTGGVGKTTISAALALGEALGGRAVDVMTVDPAPRLLDALGLTVDSGELSDVELDGIPHSGQGRLRAMKLDPKATFDSLIARYAPSETARDAILENRLYQNLSQALAGVGDYMAMEKLLELCADAETDLIVLDTPPAREALDFLDAPRRVLELLNSRAAALLGASTGFFGQSLKLVDLAARAMLAAFDRLTGLHLLADVQSFVSGFDGMYGGFAERAERAHTLVRDRGKTLIVVVTAAEAQRVEETRAFIDSLNAMGLKVGALVVNRAMPEMPQAADLAKLKIPSELKRKLRRNWRDFAALKARQTESLSALRAMVPDSAAFVVVPDLGREPARLSDLAAIARCLSGIESGDSAAGRPD